MAETAFQYDAFQTDAFQIEEVVGVLDHIVLLQQYTIRWRIGLR